MADERFEDPVDVLRRLVGPVHRAAEALHFVKALSRLGIRGSALVVVLDQDRRLLDVLTVVDGSEDLALLVELTCCYAEARYLFLAVDRTGEAPTDRPDDELLWLELKDFAWAKDLVLCDLFVVSGSTAFSVAELAPDPAQWA